MDTSQILEAYAKARGLPRDAIAAAEAQREEVLPEFLAVLDAVATDHGPVVRDAPSPAYLVFHQLGSWHETRAYRPMARFLRSDPKRLYWELGDALTETVHRIIVNVFDGDPAPLYEVIEDQEADEYVRSRLLEALAMLVRQGALPREEVARYLRDGYDRLHPQAPNFVWVGWQSAIALLGLSELGDLVRRAFERGWIDPMIMKFEHFEADLRRAVADPDTAKRFEEEQLTPFGDILDELSWWDERVEEMEKEERRKASARSAPQGSQPSLVAKPVVNPLGKVGRNDPCPCGSGRKFKKCCGR